MRRPTRFAVGTFLGGGALVGYLAFVGVEDVLARAGAVAPWAVGLVVFVVAAEGLVDSVGVWASSRPLGNGLSVREAVTFAMAGDFFSILSPAGPVSSEPILARFLAVTTGTTYSEALGVRTTAKYVKSGAQAIVSVVLGAAVLAGGADAGGVLLTFGVAIVVVVALGVSVVVFRQRVSQVTVAALTPVLTRVSGIYREDPSDRAAVDRAVGRFFTRALSFRDRPGLVALIALGGVLEQAFIAGALWVGLAGTGTVTALLPIVVLVPLPEVSSALPIPGSVGAYDVLLSGALVVATGAPAVTTAAAVLVFRTVSVPFGLCVGGVAAALLRGWRVSTG